MTGLTPVAEGEYLSPAERMRRIRHTRAVLLRSGFTEAEPEFTPEFWCRAWNEFGILAIPGIRLQPPRVRRDRTWARRRIAHGDWRERVKRKRRISTRFRRIVIARAQGCCHYCGRSVPDGYFQIDHVVPVTRGGRSRLGNLVAACWKCNQDKSDLLPGEWSPRWYWNSQVRH